MLACQSFPGLFSRFVFVIWGGWLYCSTIGINNGFGCRSLRFVKPVDGFALQGHVIENISLPMPFDDVRFECRSLCGMESTCVSINIGLPGNDGAILCQLSNSDHIKHPEDLKPQEGFLYWATRNPCSNDPCLHNATCLNGFTDKRYICLCQVGYTGEHCENEIDECTMNGHECGANAVCISNGGTYKCSCKKGFHGDEITCMDIDECAWKTDNCSVHAVCTNTKGSFTCDCKKGFNGNGNKCSDINECTEPVDPCNAVLNSVCNNTEGSYNCQCKDGFRKNGSVCKDIDECAAPFDPCNAVANSICNNTSGSYNCLCKDGFVKNGPVCEADVCQNYQTLSNAERKDTYVTVSAQCDYNLNGWYRFQGAAGTQMAVTCPSENRCGGNFPGWLSNGHPTVADGTVTRRVCFNRFGDCCDVSTIIQVKNCDSHYIYKLSGTPGCNSRYCGTG